MTVKFDETKTRKGLILLYSTFLEDPSSEEVYEMTMAFHKTFGGLSDYNNILKEQPVPRDIERALHGLSTIYQYGVHSNDHPAFSDDKILKEAKEILEELKKAK